MLLSFAVVTMRRSGVLRFAVVSALVVASRGRRNCTDVIPDGTLGNVADWWGTNSSGGDFTRCDGDDVVAWIVENEGYACRDKNKWVNKEWCQRTCYDIGASFGGSWGRDGGDARFMYADCGTAADSAEDVSIRVESQPIQDTFNLSVPERIFGGSLSSRRELGERIRTVQESWETSSI